MKSLNGLNISEYLKANLDKYKYILAVCAVGLVLALWPWGGESEPLPAPVQEEAYSPDALAAAITEAIREVAGVGEAKVLLTLRSGYEQVYAYNQSGQAGSTQVQLVTLSGGGGQTAVVRKVLSPEFMGAVVICQGGDSPKVQLALTQILKALTGVSADHIVVTKMKQ